MKKVTVTLPSWIGQDEAQAGERIDPAARVSIEDVLTELATRLQSKGQI